MMKDFFEKLYSALCQNENFVLVSIVSSSGSTPRGNGAKMAVFEDGHIAGTIGGGNVEYLSIQMALLALKEHSSCLKGFNLSKNQTADIGMICGGQVDVCFQYIDSKNEDFKSLLMDILLLFSEDIDAWLITSIVDETAQQLGIFDRKNGLRHMDHTLLPELAPYFKGKAVLSSGQPTYFVEPLMSSGYTYVFGGGHVAQALVPVIAQVGFRPVIYEDREAFADPALFIGADRTILWDYKDIGSRITLNKKDFAVIMTRGHQSDYEILEQLLKSPAGYIGVIGSRKKIAATRERLLAAGFDEKALARIHAPIGLAIKAETPAEIAVSIAAELILCRAQLHEGLS